MRLASDAMLQCLIKFTEHFSADKHPDTLSYNNAISAITHVMEDPVYTPHIEKLLHVLEKCKHHNEENDNFKGLRAAMVMMRLRADERIHDVLADLTGYFIEGNEDQDERLSMECYILSALPGIRKSIKALRDGYPEYFRLNQQFYLDALNERKTEFLTNKYYAMYKRLERMNGAFDYGDDYDNEFELPEETVKPYVRETPKVGRNDPCPCGSGKKYKRCCG